MNYNLQQKQAIETIEGPLLIVAGPGTGKTFTLVERVKYMVKEKNIDPGQILISTFTNKAAFELVDRLSIQFQEEGINKDVNDMVVGNFHSICRDINDQYLSYTNLKKSYTQLDEIGQNYLIQRYIGEFRKIPGYDKLISRDYELRDLVNLVNRIREEGILIRTSSDPFLSTGLNILSLYEKILESFNMIDFSGILFTSYKLLYDNPWIVEEIHKKINYIMIDEYQDTNKLQEKIIFLILNDNKNICVVGDDDQSLYRFRGASVRNILEFDKKFKDVKLIKLMQNYRSEDSIIKFYSSYLADLVDSNPELKDYRHKKILFSDKLSGDKRVHKLITNNEEEWTEKTYNLILDLKKKDMINSYNEIAILVSSLSSAPVRNLVSYIKKRGIGVYSPKTATLLSKKEVRLMIGALYGIFKKEIDKNVSYRPRDTQLYLNDRYDDFYKELLKDKDLESYVERMSDFIASGDFSLNLYDIYYRLFAYEPFYSFMKEEAKAKTLSKYLELLNTFSLISQIFYINPSNINKFIEIFFYEFVAFIKDQRVPEFEEETRIPPEDSISILTIHASKGMEYPVVLMGSLWDRAFAYKKFKTRLDRLIDGLNKNLGQESDFEPFELTNKLDFYRKYYTGFSRARDLLILTGFEKGGVSEELKSWVDALDEISLDKLNIEKGPVKDNFVKLAYSYTGDILSYRQGEMNYYYSRKLRFPQVKTKALFYGSIVHESIEYINKAVIQGKDKKDLDVYNLVRDIAVQKFRQGAISFGPEDLKKAVGEVKSYVENMDRLGKLLYSELPINFSSKKFVLVANVDLVYEKDGKIHIMDFKTGLPAEKHKDDDLIRSYFDQINLYAYLLKKTKNIEVASMSLYFTDLSAEKKLYSFDFNEEENNRLLAKITKTIEEIEKEEYSFESSYRTSGDLLSFFLDKYYEESQGNATN